VKAGFLFKIILILGMIFGSAGCTGIGSAKKASLSSPPSTPSPAKRNVFLQPFASTSIWNTPIGSDAVYVAANIVAPSNLSMDESQIVFGPSSPLQQIYTNTVGWSGGSADRCAATQTLYTGARSQLPIPIDAVFNATNLPDGTPNASTAVLLQDRETLWQSQPAVICSAGGPISSQYTVAETSLYGDGIYGSHGGSHLSALGGVIRMNEIIPGDSPIVDGVADVMRHALCIQFDAGVFGAFGTGPFWPATNQDGAAEGLLVALLPTFDFNGLQTPPARSIAWTLINYGAYIVDSTAWDDMAFCTEFSFADSSVNVTSGRTVDQFQSVWGYSMSAFPANSTPFGRDIQAIATSLHVITNNTPSSIGGGGTPRQPLLPDLESGQ
jgi:hypothetical protein